MMLMPDQAVATEMDSKFGKRLVQTRQTLQADLECMAEHATVADKEEWYAATGEDLLTSLRQAAEVSGVESWFVDGQMLALFGLRRAGAWGIPWSLCTNLVFHVPRLYLFYSQAVLVGLARSFPMVVQKVDARHERALRWASKVGFEVYPTVPYGPFNLPFHPIAMRGTRHV